MHKREIARAKGVVMPDDITPAEAPAAEEAQAQHAEKTYTQADIDRIIGERIAGVKSKYADYEDAKKAAAELAELKAAQMTEVERVKAEAEAARAELEAARAEAKNANTRALRIKVGTEKGLPSPLIDRLTGEDEESIAADADAILSVMPKPAAPGGSNPPGEAPDPKDSDPFLKGLWGR
jgi:hypothetical protein